MKKFDAIIIGTGQSGPSLAVRFAKAGRKVAIFERKLFGGTCVNVGCIPSKTLIASARAAHVARRAKEFGVNFGGEVSVDMKRVKERKDEVVHQSNDGISTWLEETETSPSSADTRGSNPRRPSRSAMISTKPIKSSSTSEGAQPFRKFRGSRAFPT